jgi:spore coat protein A
MTVVGSDEGYLRAPAAVDDLLISPGERYTVVLDFTGRGGEDWVLANDAAAPYPFGGAEPAGDRTGQLMEFRVGARASSADGSRIPSAIPEPHNGTITVDLLRARLRTVQAGEIQEGKPLLGDAAALRAFTDPVTETPQLGSTEAWAFRNHSPDAHPIHLHMVSLRLVGRWPAVFDGAGRPVSVGAFEPPAAYESGPKDTFVSPPGYLTAWEGTFTIAGGSVWHCHILSHEDTTMMRPILVGNTPQTGFPRVLTLRNLDQLVRQA